MILLDWPLNVEAEPVFREIQSSAVPRTEFSEVGSRFHNQVLDPRNPPGEESETRQWAERGLGVPGE